jgi:hypothetical protein
VSAVPVLFALFALFALLAVFLLVGMLALLALLAVFLLVGVLALLALRAVFLLVGVLLLLVWFVAGRAWLFVLRVPLVLLLLLVSGHAWLLVLLLLPSFSLLPPFVVPVSLAGSSLHHEGFCARPFGCVLPSGPRCFTSTTNKNERSTEPHAACAGEYATYLATDFWALHANCNVKGSFLFARGTCPQPTVAKTTWWEGTCPQPTVAKTTWWEGTCPQPTVAKTTWWAPQSR